LHYQFEKQQKITQIFKEPSLLEQWKLTLKDPLNVPVKAINEYFGTKIGLFFMFLRFETKSLAWLILVFILVRIFITIYFINKKFSAGFYEYCF
jgi:hypothetical protein